MFSRWMVITAAVLTASANPDRAGVAQGTVIVEPTSEVKGQQEAELTLNCGNGKSSGLVQYWHTPFGDLWRPGFVDPGPVLMRSDGTLMVSNCSRRHGGLYYCLLQDTRGTTLWPYQVHIHPDHGGLEEVQVASRSRKGVWSDDGVSQQDLAAAVAAAVLLTFVVGFSAGALSRTYVLRCLGAIRTRMRSPRQQSDHADGSGVTMTTLPPWCSHQEAEAREGDETMETTVSSITSSPPIKPQRSFRQKGDEEAETSVYLEGCGHVKGEETTSYLEGCGHIEEEEEGLEEENQEEEGTYGGLYLSGGDEEEKEDEEEEEEEQREEKETQGRQEEEKGDEEEEEQREEKETQGRQEEEKGDEEEEEEQREEKETQGRQEEEKGDQEDDNDKEEGRKEKDTQRRRREEKEGDEEEEERRREKETKGRRQEQEEEVQCPHSEASSEGGDAKPEAPSESRRRRVIRLYQYDEEGQRYRHLPDPTPDEPGPAPRLRQRSVSLTRLNAIMAAASAGPLDPEGVAGRREETNFHMDI